MNIRPDRIYQTRSEATKRQEGYDLANNIQNSPEKIKRFTKQKLARELPLRQISDEELVEYIGIENTVGITEADRVTVQNKEELEDPIAEAVGVTIHEHHIPEATERYYFDEVYKSLNKLNHSDLQLEGFQENLSSDSGATEGVNDEDLELEVDHKEYRNINIENYIYRGEDINQPLPDLPPYRDIDININIQGVEIEQNNINQDLEDIPVNRELLVEENNQNPQINMEGGEPAAAPFNDADVAEIEQIEQLGLRRAMLELIRRARIPPVAAEVPAEPVEPAAEPDLRVARERIVARVGQLRTTELLPSKFDGEDIKATESHISGFADFCQLHGYDLDPDKIVWFKTTLRGGAREWFDSQTFLTYDDLKEKFINDFSDVSSREAALSKLRSFKWDGREKAVCYLTKLRKLGRKVNMGNQSIMDHFKLGLPLAARNYVDCSNPDNIDQMVRALQKFSDNNGPISTQQVSFGAVTVTPDEDPNIQMQYKEAHIDEVAARSAAALLNLLDKRESKSNSANARSRSQSPKGNNEGQSKGNPSQGQNRSNSQRRWQPNDGQFIDDGGLDWCQSDGQYNNGSRNNWQQNERHYSNEGNNGWQQGRGQYKNDRRNEGVTINLNGNGQQHPNYRGNNRNPSNRGQGRGQTNSRGGYNNNNRGSYNSQQRGGYNNNNRGGYNNQQRGGYNNQQRGSNNGGQRGGQNQGQQVECYSCGKKGHYARDCWSKQGQQNRQGSNDQTKDFS